MPLSFDDLMRDATAVTFDQFAVSCIAHYKTDSGIETRECLGIFSQRTLSDVFGASDQRVAVIELLYADILSDVGLIECRGRWYLLVGLMPDDTSGIETFSQLYQLSELTAEQAEDWLNAR